MARGLATALALVACAAAVQAHMVYVVPAKDGQSLTVVFSDSLEPDEKVKMDKLAGLKLVARIDGKDVPVEYTKANHSFTAKAPKGASVVYGTAVYGLLSKSEKPTLLVYHPKAVLSGATAKSAPLGEAAALEIVPLGEGGMVRFQLLAKGKPVAGAEGTVVLPDGNKEKVTTDKDGYTPDFEKPGRYAAYLKLAEAKAGEHDGKKYEEVRHYATLVVNIDLPRHVEEFLKVKAKYLEDLKPILADRDKAMVGAKTEDEREKVTREVRRAARTVYTPAVKKVLDLVRDRAAEESSVGALVWAAYYTDGDNNEAVELLRKYHPTHRMVLDMMSFYQNAPRGWSEQLLRDQLASEKLEKSDRPRLLYYLALSRRAYSEWPYHIKNATEGELTEHIEIYGAETVAKFRSADPAKARAEALQLLRELSDKYGKDVSDTGATYAEFAKGGIFELENLSLGNVAPDIVGEDLDGVPFKLSDYRGKVVVLTFWASWCAPCMRMVPHEKELVKRMANKPFVLIGVNGDGDKKALKQVTDKAGITWRSFWCGEKGADGEIPKAWNVQGWPTLYVLDGTGVIRAKFSGPAALDRVVDKLVLEAEKK